MQAPEGSTTLGSLHPPEPTGTQLSPHHQWLSNLSLGTLGNTNPTHKKNSEQTAYWNWQLGGALTGTAVASAGLAMPYASQPAIAMPAGDAYLSAEQVAVSVSGSSSQTAALNKGTAIVPAVTHSAGQVQQPLFSPAASQPATFVSSSQNSFPQNSSPQNSSPRAPQLTKTENGGWNLTYSEPASRPIDNGARSTQTVVSQIVTQNRTQQTCAGQACRGLNYIQTQLPEARQAVHTIQQKIADFEAKHGQSDFESYKEILLVRILEMTDQKTQVTIDLAETNRYIGQIKVRLASIDVPSELPKHLLALDTQYQTQWLALQSTERELLKEFSQANVDATALNRIYTRYEQQQIDLYQAAQAVLGNYLLANENQAPGQSTNAVYIEPAALDLLQALTVAIHQKDVQQLRDRTVQQAQATLQTRHKELAQNIGEYEALQYELTEAISRVARYERENERITSAASAATLVGNSANKNATNSSQTQAASAFAIAESLQPQLPDGSIGKTLLSIVIAAGAVAVAAQRRAGDVSAMLSLEIEPASKPKLPRIKQIQQRIRNPIQPSLLTELLEITGGAKPAFATEGVPLSLFVPASGNSFDPSPQRQPFGNAPLAISLPMAQATGQSFGQSFGNIQLSQENLVQSQSHRQNITHELEEIINDSTPEVRFAKEVIQRGVEPVRLSLDEIDAFAESAVHWVLNNTALNDIINGESTDSIEVKETASV